MKGYLCAVLLLSSVISEAQIFTSTAEQTHLIELFTSEGCSSCPPAERKLNELTENPDLWSRVVPIAFHVDYWNYLGWNDRFSKAEFTARQRLYAKHWKARTVYTPCFVMDGIATRSTRIPSTKDSAGILKAEINGDSMEVSFKPSSAMKRELIAWIVPLSGETLTQINAGENRGRTLSHCFIAQGLDSSDMRAEDGVYSVTLPFNPSADTQAVAVWVSGKESLVPIQATGGWLK